MQAAMNGAFDILLAEALDRLPCDQDDISGLIKRMEFAGIKIITLSEGEISSLHIGLKGTMNAMFLKDLADKTRKGLQVRIEKGKSGRGVSYGYHVKNILMLRVNPLAVIVKLMKNRSRSSGHGYAFPSKR